TTAVRGVHEDREDREGDQDPDPHPHAHDRTPNTRRARSGGSARSARSYVTARSSDTSGRAERTARTRASAYAGSSTSDTWDRRGGPVPGGPPPAARFLDGEEPARQSAVGLLDDVLPPASTLGRVIEPEPSPQSGGLLAELGRDADRSATRLVVLVGKTDLRR